VVFQLQLLLFSGLAFFLMLSWLKRTLTITLDVDWLYRCLAPLVGRDLDRMAGNAWQRLVTWAWLSAVYLGYQLHRHHGPEGVFGRTWPTGTMAFWTTVMLTLYLVLANL
jgi:multicomponent Na+:H+ antiporter subunit D